MALTNKKTLISILAIIVVLVLVFFGFKSCSKKDDKQDVVTNNTQIQEVVEENNTQEEVQPEVITEEVKEETVIEEVKDEVDVTTLSYWVNFLNYDGSVISRKSYTYGSTPVAPTDPTYTDDVYYFSFTGWDKTVTPVYGTQTYQAQYIKTGAIHNDDHYDNSSSNDGNDNDNQRVISLSKGDIIIIDNKQYLVMKNITGNQYMLLAKYNAADTQQIYSSNGNAYFTSDVDAYLTDYYYNSLSFKDALVDTSITQYKYSCNGSVFNDTTHASYADMNTKVEVATQNRKVFLLDVADIEEYFGEIYSTDNVKNMFASSGQYWLRSARAGDSGGAFGVSGDYGRLSDGSVDISHAVRPAFVVDLTNVDFKNTYKVSYVLSPGMQAIDGYGPYYFVEDSNDDLTVKLEFSSNNGYELIVNVGGIVLNSGVGPGADYTANKNGNELTITIKAAKCQGDIIISCQRLD